MSLCSKAEDFWRFARERAAEKRLAEREARRINFEMTQRVIAADEKRLAKRKARA